MSDTTAPAKKPFLSNTQYDALKWVALVGLPALGALYFGLAPLWDLPKSHEIVGTITLVDTFLGLLLGVVNKNYNKSDARFDGFLNVIQNDNRLIQQLDIQTPPEEMPLKNEIVLKVQQVPSE